jgi:hypothetical protein
MPSCYQNYDVRTLLWAKETKINKGKQVLSDLDDLCFFEPHRYQEVLTKMAIVREMIAKTLDKAREVIFEIPHGWVRYMPPRLPARRLLKHKKKKSQNHASPNLTLSYETVSRPTICQLHIMRTASKTEVECKLHDAHQLTLSLPNPNYISRPIYFDLLPILIINNMLLRK